MKRTYYIRDEQGGSPRLRRLLIILLCVALAAGGAIGYYLYAGERRAATILGDFETALGESRYEEAVELYRLTQSKALTDNWTEPYKDRYKATLKEMGLLVTDRLAALKNAIKDNNSLSDDDLAFAGQMAEITAAPLAKYLREQCAAYLAGKTGLDTLTRAFDQLAGLDNLKDTVGGLPAEFPLLTEARPMMKAALAAQDDGRYWEAWQGFADLLADNDLAGFVHDQARQKQEKCQKAMYQPLLDEAKALMEGGRYLSARDALQKMAAVYEDDTTIQALLDECSGHLPAEYADYTGTVEVLSVKPLIVRPDLAFDGDAYASTADDSMLTVTEFGRMLDELYAKNYVLIDAGLIASTDGTRPVLRLPAGKKPLIIVLEGLNYYATRRQTGNCWDLVMDEGGEVSGEYQSSDGSMVVDREAEAIGILDLFVAAHPDFSHDGAKGVISLTGYECLFGKIVDEDQLDDRNQALTDNGFSAVSMTAEQIAANKQNAQQIISRLLATGWQFASSSYGFIDVRNSTLDRLQADTAKWLDQIGSLTGPVMFYNYPSGAFVAGSDERAIWLQSQGFILYGGLGTTAYLYAGSGYVYVDKTPVNGFTMRNSGTYQLDRLFDAGKVYDSAVRP